MTQTQPNVTTRNVIAARKRGRAPIAAATVQPVATDETPASLQADAQAVAPGALSAEDEAKIKEALKDYWLTNKEANKLATQAKKKFESLEALMAKHGSERIAMLIPLGSGAVEQVVGEVVGGTKNVVNVEKLRKEVSDEDFMKCVSATQTQVTAVAGTNVLARCLQTVATAPALKVRKGEG